MLEAAIKFEKAFERYEEEDDKYLSAFKDDDNGRGNVGPPISEDWDNARVNPLTLNFNILAWWKENSKKYKILAQIACDVLADPVSTMASESAFSTRGRILDPFRSSLSLKTMEALVCAQNWFKSTYGPLQLKDFMDEIQTYENIESVAKASSGSCLDEGIELVVLD
ncbi:HAT, C-terminal dimerization domain containing protein [Parasponia andersonii]|uniref:HAT, C-terminal dimerization domain containing protein n=1 Tax=Parasponia andersonii TaxID=3476 RepID=A0A2P5DTJ3_PARAD|nr:HAT, C-terminal dimerization domain containing protein [Parasponia andersonii]